MRRSLVISCDLEFHFTVYIRKQYLFLEPCYSFIKQWLYLLLCQNKTCITFGTKLVWCQRDV